MTPATALLSVASRGQTIGSSWDVWVSESFEARVLSAQESKEGKTRGTKAARGIRNRVVGMVPETRKEDLDVSTRLGDLR